MILTEDEVRTRLRAAVDKFPSQLAFANEHEVSPTYVCRILAGRLYNGTSGSFPPSVLSTIGVRKRVVYELVEDEQEEAA